MLRWAYNCKVMSFETDKISRKALGRSSTLGALYDFTKDDFTGDIIFKANIPDSEIKSQYAGDKNYVSIQTSDSLEERFKLLDVKGELRASFMAGLFEVKGSGKYLDDAKKTSKSSSLTLIYSVSTKTETIYLRHLRDYIDFDLLANTKATHILTEINWGANCTVNAKYEYSSDTEKLDIAGHLNAELKKIKGTIDMSGNADLKYQTNKHEKKVRFDFNYLCDVQPDGANLPETFEDARKLAVTLPTFRLGKPLE